MSFYPENPNTGTLLQSDSGPTVTLDKGFVAHYQVAAASATVASTTGIHAAVTDTGVDVVVTTGITQPSVPRALSATAGGTAGDVKAIQVTVTGTNFAGAVISEALPAFTVNTTGSVSGAKAFKTVTSIAIPAHDGLGATTAVGYLEVLGLPDKLTHNTVIAACHNNAREATAPTVTVSSTAIESNTVDLNTALNSSIVDVYYIV